MRRLSPDAGRRRARRRDDGAAADVVPLCATGVLAVATLAITTFVAPDSLRATVAATATEACQPHSTALHARDDTRG
ncbi:hypothetical protein [Pseudoxanthomonas sp. PXM02]|uniref:hypothetical protein n=1 Tax=Pseudoxanthomonas sp. PXM02 TaxID=2769294 RepID=UPI001782E4A4|nr:hypothetical protein [Pseudoxanthomonas sp. PXM02]MBD9478087.1 hypothetical protein [Pseudoxanthomonas sp. PXM02]